MRILQSRFILIALRWVLVAVFIYAGINKLGSPQNFSDNIATFAILSNSLINLLSLSLPPFEIVAGLAMITGVQRRPATLGLTALTAIFMVALGAAIVRGIPVNCGCFGSDKTSASTTWIALGRDIIIFVAGALLYFLEIRKMRSTTQEVGFSHELNEQIRIR